MSGYTDFFLTINGTPGAYTVEARGPGEITVSPVNCDLSISSELDREIENIRSGASLSRQRMQAVGKRLFEALLPRPILRALSRSYDELPPETHLRLKLVIRPPELNTLPWECLYDPDEGNFLAARLTSPIVRFIESGTPAAPLLAPHPLRLLYVQAAPRDLPPLDLETSQNALLETLGVKAEVTTLKAATPASLREALQQPFHILHYDGHAYFDSENQQGFICLQDPTGKTHFLSGEMLATYLDGSSVRLAVLAACGTGTDSTNKRFSGIAHQLMKSSNLPTVVAMQFSIPNASAVAFTRGFYRALADGLPTDAAVTQGRKAILEIKGGDPFAAPDWATPVLFMRSVDGDILGSSQKIEEKKMSEEQKKDKSEGIHFGGQASVQGDVFTGGKHQQVGNISGVSGGTIQIVGGNVITTTSQGVSLQEFTNLLAEIQRLLPQAKLDEDTAQAVTSDLQTVQSQAAKEKPAKALILSKLKGTAELIGAASGVATAVQSLAPLLQKAMELAQKLF